jgi:predicted ATPase/class 3 adenylate cyclase
LSAEVRLPSGVVTFLFTDIEGSTRLAQMLGTGYRPVLTEHRRLLCRELTACGGTPLFSEGDSLFVAFADARSALNACVHAQQALIEHDWPAPEARPLVRMGLHTGHAVPQNGEYASHEVHRAARIAAAAHGGQVLCSAATAREAGALDQGALDQRGLEHEGWLLDLGLHRLRGFDDRERLYQLVAPSLTRQFPRPRTEDATPHNLPLALTRFIGRTAEMRELTDLLAEDRLVTVAGPAGAGKTRLAVEAAGRRAGAYPDGVWFVDLATAIGDADIAGVAEDAGLVDVVGLADGARVVEAVAAALGLRPEPGRAVLETIAEYAATRKFLLLLDTCDAHPAASAGVVARVLASGPGARVLATSTAPLGQPGEVIWRIPPLSLAAGPGGEQSEAVELLLDRAAAVRGLLAGDRPQADPDLHRVAERLEGLPLALELAAAKLRVLSPAQLVARLDDMLGVLSGGTGTPARHHTLGSSVAWSYRRLHSDSARLLRWLSVFAGRVDLASVERLLGEDPLESLAALVDRSLVQAQPASSGMTYRLAAPVRAYAAQALVEAGEEQVARDRHLEWVLHRLEHAPLGPDRRPGLAGAVAGAATRLVALSLDALDPLAADLRAGLTWAATRGSARLGLRIAAGLDHWWRERCLTMEARAWLRRLYHRLAESGEQVPSEELAGAYHVHATQALLDGEYDEQARFLGRAEAAARRTGDPGLLVRIRAGHARRLLAAGEVVEAERYCRGLLGWAQRNGVAGEALGAVHVLAEILWLRADLGAPSRGAQSGWGVPSRGGHSGRSVSGETLDEAAELVAAARGAESAQPVERSLRTIDMMLGMVALARFDLVAAHDHLTVALRARMSGGFNLQTGEAVRAIAVRCALGGDLRTAARLFGSVQRVGPAAGQAGAGAFDRYWLLQQAAVRTALGDVAFDAGYAEGGGLSLAEATAVALAVEHPDLADGSVRFSDADSRAAS